MLTAKITSKGQITLPLKIRQRLGVQVGETVSFEEAQEGFLVKKVLKKSPFDRWVGSLRHLQGNKSDGLVQEMRGQ
jgi:AbrB family looped-hinge helix DNA binding protein